MRENIPYNIYSTINENTAELKYLYEIPSITNLIFKV